MRRLRPADVGAGAAGVALLVVLFLQWYGERGNLVPVAISQFTGSSEFRRVTTHGPLPNPSGWQAFSVVDIVLAVAALLAIGVVAVTATARGPAKPVASTVIATVASGIAVLLVLWRLLDPPQDIYAPHYGIWLGLAVTLLMFVASFAALHDERTPGAVPPDIPRRPAPPA